MESLKSLFVKPDPNAQVSNSPYPSLDGDPARWRFQLTLPV